MFSRRGKSERDLMASKHRHEPDTLDTLQEGDFRRISGIGPGIEHRLRSAGIETFDQLAEMDVIEMVAALQGTVGITAERIITQEWKQQARRFAEELRERYAAAEAADREAEREDRQ